MDGGAWWAAVHGVAKSWTRLSDFTFTFHFHALEKEMATYSSVLAWRIPGTGEPGGLPSMGSHRVRHNWSDLAAAVLYHIFTQLLCCWNSTLLQLAQIVESYEVPWCSSGFSQSQTHPVQPKSLLEPLLCQGSFFFSMISLLVVTVLTITECFLMLSPNQFFC